MSESFIVAVRIRPPSAAELNHPHHRPIIQPVTTDTLVFDPPADLSDWTDPAAAAAAAATRRLSLHPTALPSTARHKDLHYAFDHVFPPTATQAQVYQATAGRLIARVLDGYNATVFAYGATGAGKTHTMIGTAGQPGVMVATMHDLFAGMRARESGRYEVSVSYMEVYNEQIRDLLSPSPTASPLQLREEPNGAMTIAGLTSHTPSSAAEVFRMLERGNNRRTQSATEANAQSSRSHAVLQVTLRRRDVDGGRVGSRVRVAKLSLIDLAGSERAAVSKNRGQTLKEGANINRSLLALGNCINQLAARSKHSADEPNAAADSHKPPPRTPRRTRINRGKENKQPTSTTSNNNKHTTTTTTATTAASASFVPYRDSKLTRLLKDSLGGNCLTVMIANVSPSALSSEDSHNTLKYANRAKDIQVRVEKNERSVGWHVSQYEERMKEMREEIDMWKAKCEKADRTGSGEDGEVERRKEEWVARLLACVKEREAVEHRISSTKSSLVKLNATLAIQQDEMDCWQRIAHLSPTAPLSTTLSTDLANHHKQRTALLAKLQQHTAALTALSASLASLLAGMKAELPASLHGAVEASVQHALDVIGLREARVTVDSYSNMVSEYRQRLMANNKHHVTLVHALQSVFAGLSDEEKAKKQPLYQQALNQVHALPVSPRLYDTLTENERNVLSALVVEQEGKQTSGDVGAETAGARMEEDTPHEEINFQYASLDAQHRRTATQSLLPGVAAAMEAGSSRPTTAGTAAEGRVSVWTGKAFDYRSASLASTAGAHGTLAGPIILPVVESATAAMADDTAATAPVASVMVAPVRPSVSFAPSTYHPRSPSVASPGTGTGTRVSSLSTILSPQSATSASPQVPVSVKRVPTLTTGSSSFSSHFSQLMHSPPPTNTSKHQPLPPMETPAEETDLQLQQENTTTTNGSTSSPVTTTSTAPPHQPTRPTHQQHQPATPTSYHRLTTNPPPYTSIPSAFFHAPPQPLSTPGRSHGRMGSGGTPLKAPVASVVASLPFAVNGGGGGGGGSGGAGKEEERKVEEKEEKASSVAAGSASSPSQMRLAAATSTPTFKRSYAAVLSPATLLTSPSLAPPPLPTAAPSPLPPPTSSVGSLSQRLFRPPVAVSSGIPRLTPAKGKRPLDRSSGAVYGRLMGASSPSSLPVYKKALTRW